MDISVIIPNYNGQVLLEKNLKKIITILQESKISLRRKIELIIIDDHSSDGGAQFVAEQIQENKTDIAISFLQNERNIGFSPTINKAVKHARGDILYLLNSDVLPEHDFLYSLLPHFSDEKIFAVGSMDKSIEKGKTVLRGRGIGGWQRGFLVHRRGEVDKADTLWVNGGSGAFRKSVWQKLGGFCELYAPYYWEDIDLSYYAQKSGYRVLFEPKSVVVHEHDEGAIKKTQRLGKIKRIAYRNQFFFVWLSITDTSFLLQHFFWLPYYFVRTLPALDFSFFFGFLQAVSKLSLVLQERKRRKKQFTLSDRNVLAQYSQET